jgi:CRISPR-associated protein Csx10
MYAIKYRITTLAPVQIATLSGDRNLIGSRQYIPGTAVLGLLANHYLKYHPFENAHGDPDFCNWFLAGTVKISNACICETDENGDEYIHFPAPLSLMEEKYSDSGSEESTLYDLLHTEPDKVQPDWRSFSGRHCNFQDELTSCSVDTVIRFHHARDREKGISQQGQIFNYEAIAPGQVFEGQITGNRDDLSAMAELIRKIQDAALGRSRNVEYGRVKITLSQSEPEPLPATIPARPRTLTLLSDLILYNEYGYAAADITSLAAELTRLLGCRVQVIRSFIRSTVTEQFLAVWRLKRPSETCFTAGSAFLLQMDDPLPHDLPARVAAIQAQGLGMRTHEGFGCCAFNLQLEEEATCRNLSILARQKKAAEPEGSMPDHAKEVVKQLCTDFFLENVRLSAHQELAGFTRLPSASLISKLLYMAEQSADRDEFVGKLNRMRKLGLDQLKKCVSGKYNLLEFLAMFTISRDKTAHISEIDQKQFTHKEKTFVLIEDIKRKGKDENKGRTRDRLIKHLLPSASYRYDPVATCVNDMKKKYPDFFALCNRAGLNPQEDKSLNNRMLKSFYSSFFTRMRKLKKTKQEKGQNNG